MEELFTFLNRENDCNLRKKSEAPLAGPDRGWSLHPSDRFDYMDTVYSETDTTSSKVSEHLRMQHAMADLFDDSSTFVTSCKRGMRMAGTRFHMRPSPLAHKRA